MNAFVDACTVEEKSKNILIPFLKMRAHEGRFVVTSKGPLSRVLQETVGDVLYNSDSERIYAAELKAEEANKFGNFFLETWSNRNLEDKARHAELGSNPGWFLKLKADLLLYHFLAEDLLYVIDLFKLQRWAFRACRLYEFPERPQGKRVQLNDTWGRCVPIGVIEREVGLIGGAPFKPGAEMEAADA